MEILLSTAPQNFLAAIIYYYVLFDFNLLSDNIIWSLFFLYYERQWIIVP